jgi:SAM-dependent methyltransferase
MGMLAKCFDWAYDAVCGRHPHRRMSHFQWLSTRDLYRDLREVLPSCTGEVLDVGCGDKPYGPWLSGASRHFGIDLVGGERVDLAIRENESWPLEADRFDAALCTQVLQYVKRPEGMLAELYRVLKRGGTLVLTVPYSYNSHAVLKDYWRWSAEGIGETLSDRFEVLEVRKEGRIGTFSAVPFLNWTDSALGRRAWTRVLKGACLPAWILFTFGVNVAAAILDALDGSGKYYTNVLVVARRK